MSGIVMHLLATPMWVTLLVVFALPALESSAFLGFVFPGESAVLLGGVAASQGHVPLLAVAAAAVGGAIAGDAVGYVVGRRWGRRLLDSAFGRFVKADHLDKAERALDRRSGGMAVLLGRFTIALRVMIPGLAGMARMPYRRFAVYNVTGGALWGGLVVIAGYLAGNSWHTVGHLVASIGGAVTVAVLAVLVGVRLARSPRAAALIRSIVRGSRRVLSSTPEPAPSTSEG
jgi:membrane protein DedA with SNARE-associated domain